MFENGINLKELLIRQGWEVEELRQNIYLREVVESLEQEVSEITLERDDIAKHHSLLVQENSLLKSRADVDAEKLQKKDEVIGHLTQDLEEWQKDARQWRQEKEDGLEEIERLKKQIESLVRSPPPHKPQPPQSLPHLNHRNATKTVRRRLLNRKIDLPAISSLPREGDIKQKAVHSPSFDRTTQQRSNSASRQLYSTPINNKMLSSSPSTHKSMHQPLAPISIRSSSIVRRSSHTRLVSTASSQPQALSKSNRLMLNPTPPATEDNRHKAAVYQHSYKKLDDGAENELDLVPRPRPITYGRFSPNPSHKRLNRLR